MSNIIIDNSIKISKLTTINDAEKLCNLFADAFNSSIDKKFVDGMIDRFNNSCYQTYGYKFNNELIAGIHLYTSDLCASINRMAVLSKFKRQQIGLSLLKDTINILRQEGYEIIHLECLSYLTDFYQLVGFETLYTDDRYDSRDRYAGEVSVMKLTL